MRSKGEQYKYMNMYNDKQNITVKYIYFIIHNK